MLGVTVQVQIDTFKEILGVVDRFHTGGGDEIFTPPNIVQDMLDLLPESVWNSKTRFLDICCKSGNFLIEIYNRLDRILSSDNNFKDPVKRRKHILENQIYGICNDDFEEMLIKRRILGDAFSDNDNISTVAYVHPVSGASKQFRELAQLSKQKTLKKREEQLGYLKDAIKEKFKQMDFDVVVGNPPYNNDMYLDFVMIGHELAKQFTLMITPAKWQAKGGGQNDLFRKTIVPYMSKIVYYPVAFEIFDILEPGGVSYYLIDKSIHQLKQITNICDTYSLMQMTKIKKIDSDQVLLNCADSIIRKTSKNKKLNFRLNDMSKTYRVVAVTKAPGMTHARHKDTPVYITSILSIRDDYYGREKDRISIFSTNDFSEAEQFVQYMYRRLPRFLFLAQVCKLTGVYNNYDWRFVPDPGAFDHIFTDEELYKKYNLTDDEIKLIESVIKERK